MKFKIITMIFPKALTEHQENILIANCKAIPEQVRAEVSRRRKRVEKALAFKLMEKLDGGLTSTVLKAKLIQLEFGIGRYFFLDKVSPTNYIFGHAYEELSVLNAKLGKFKLVKGEVFQEWLFLKGL